MSLNANDINAANLVDGVQLKNILQLMLALINANTPAPQMPVIAAITPATDGTTAGTALNALLAELKTAGLMAAS